MGLFSGDEAVDRAILIVKMPTAEMPVNPGFLDLEFWIRGSIRRNGMLCLCPIGVPWQRYSKRKSGSRQLSFSHATICRMQSIDCSLTSLIHP